MAGGEGSRLRPLTCDLPKPMVPVMNKPVMTYSIELLKKYGINTIGVTLQYLPHVIQDYYGDGSEYGVDLHYFIEETPLGTAGSVKNAQEILDETFIVISGDALANINLEKAIEFHRRNNSIATLVLKRVEVPLEYGVVVTDEKGVITRFLEKPNWGEVFSDTVNTGIYILEPEVLDYFELGQKFDFSQDLFPMLLKDRKPMYGYITDEYWCDIGDAESYLRAHYDMLDGKVGFPIEGKQWKENVWIGENTQIHPEAHIEGPCYIGDYNQIGKDAKILPYTVIGNYNCIAEGSSIKRSVLWNYNSLARNVEVRAAILCNKNELRNNARVFEGAVIGEGCQLNQNSIVRPSVKVWPEKSIEQGMIVQENIIWGTKYSKTLFGKDGIKGQFNIDITPNFMARLGAAFGAQLKEGKRLGVSCDYNHSSRMLKYSLISGALSTGLEVFDLGQLTTPILRYAVQALGLDGGVHIFSDQEDPRETYIHLLDERGANLSPSVERKIENIFARDDYQKQPPERIRRVNSINSIPMFYIRNLLNWIDREAISRRRFNIIVQSKDRLTNSVLYNIAEELNCSIEIVDALSEEMQDRGRYDIGIKMNNNGEIVELYNEKGNKLKKEMIIVLISLLCLKSGEGKEIVVPYNAPRVIEEIAKEYRAKIIRAKTSKYAMMEEMFKIGCQNVEKGFNQFILYFDGIASIVHLMNIMATEEKSFSALIEDIPKFYMSERAIPCPWRAKGRVMRTIIEDESRAESKVELFEGIKINHDSGWALILPDPDEPICRVFSEGVSEEYAEELTDFYERKINEIKSQ